MTSGIAALVCAAFGLWSLLRPGTDDVRLLARRSLAPAQLAAAVMLAAGAAVASAAPRTTAVMLLGICVAGAVGTLAAGSWRSARYALRRAAIAGTTGPAPGDCGGECAACPLSCGAV